MISWESTLTLLLLGCCLCRPGWADIYVYTADDGKVTLSNVPADSRYTVLISAPQEAVAEVPGIHVGKNKPGLSGKARYDQIVERVSTTYGLETALIHAVVSVESRYDPKAVSKKGAAGLMQLMPGTAQRYGVTNVFDPGQNLDGGAQYLRDLLKMFNNNVSLALAAYNAGENAVVKSGNRIPPYRETMRYVPRVLNFYQRYQAGL
jgi:soluble lytic murein transglycosylase-like protein